MTSGALSTLCFWASRLGWAGPQESEGTAGLSDCRKSSSTLSRSQRGATWLQGGGRHLGPGWLGGCSSPAWRGRGTLSQRTTPQPVECVCASFMVIWPTPPLPKAFRETPRQPLQLLLFSQDPWERTVLGLSPSGSAG